MSTLEISTARSGAAAFPPLAEICLVSQAANAPKYLRSFPVLYKYYIASCKLTRSKAYKSIRILIKTKNAHKTKNAEILEFRFYLKPEYPTHC